MSLRSCSVASSNSLRLRARSSASAGFLQTMRRSPGKSELSISARSCFGRATDGPGERGKTDERSASAVRIRPPGHVEQPWPHAPQTASAPNRCHSCLFAVLQPQREQSLPRSFSRRCRNCRLISGRISGPAGYRSSNPHAQAHSRPLWRVFGAGQNYQSALVDSCFERGINSNHRSRIEWDIRS